MSRPADDDSLGREGFRLTWHRVGAAIPEDGDGADVVAGLSATPKELPPRYFYDDRGSTLFERICKLPEYYLTRTEAALIDQAADEIGGHTGPVDVVELGSGSASKTGSLLRSYLRAGAAPRYVPIDINESIVRDGAESLLADHEGLEIHAVIGGYEQGLSALDEVLDGGAGRRPRLALFLGSTIGNFSIPETKRFLGRVHDALRPGDFFLVGTDLQKDADVIELAYNDAEGVTAAFNINMLRHLNERFRGDFQLDHFEHRAFYNRQESRIEMHLRSLADQRVRLESLDFECSVAAGEAIRTEISRKFDLDAFGGLLGSSGFEVVHAWTDPKRWFGLTLARAVVA